MKIGVVIFPGSNCDHDLIKVLENFSGEKVVELWHKDNNIHDCELVFLPGGFSYGDYLRSGAIARYSPVMESVIAHANKGGFVMGICNGFQILCECGLLPGALLRNKDMNFICENVYLKTENNNTKITSNCNEAEVLKIPIAHAEGRYYADKKTITELENNKQVLFRYCTENGEVREGINPNGSTNSIAGICNNNFNVFGMMPHPERCADKELGNTDGAKLFTALLNAVSEGV